MHQPVGVCAYGGRCTSQCRSVVFQTRNVKESVGATVLSFAERENRFLGVASTDAKENAFFKGISRHSVPEISFTRLFVSPVLMEFCCARA